MSRDFTFKEHMQVNKLSGGKIPPFGTFTAMYDLEEIFENAEKPNYTTQDKINLFKKLLEYHQDSTMDYTGSNCVDVATFLYDYCEHMELFDINEQFTDLKDTLLELKSNNGTLNSVETFNFIETYCNNIGIFSDISLKNDVVEQDR